MLVARALGLWLLALAAPVMAADSTPDLPNFTALYTIHNLTLRTLNIGSFNARLSVVGKDRFHFETHTRPAGFMAWFYKDQIDEDSRWTLHAANIRPLSYTYNRRGGSKDRLVELTFDWKRGIVENKVDGDRWRMPVPEGALDKLVVQVAMMLDLARGKRSMQYAIADGGKLKTYRFKVLGNESLETPAGRFETVKIERLRENNKRSTYLWCAPALHNLPVRVDQREEDDSQFSMLLSRYTEQ